MAEPERHSTPDDGPERNDGPERDNEPDPAIARYWMLQLMRLGGILLAFGGVAIIAGRVDGPLVLGYGLVLLGAFEFFFLPRALARRWKSPAP